MPNQWIEPELFLEYEGVTVYRCYDDDSIVSSYWYTLDAADCNINSPLNDAVQFDVRDLPDLGLDANDSSNHAAIIQNAIGEGLITDGSAML